MTIMSEKEPRFDVPTVGKLYRVGTRRFYCVEVEEVDRFSALSIQIEFALPPSLQHVYINENGEEVAVPR